MHTRLLIPVLVGSVLSFAAYAWAGSPTDQLRAYTDQVLKVLEKSRAHVPGAPYRGPEDRRRGIRRVRNRQASAWHTLGAAHPR